MFSSLKRANYNVIEEVEDENEPGTLKSMELGRVTDIKLNEEEEVEEECHQHFESSAPPIHHGVAVSFSGKGDAELQASSDPAAEWDHIKDVDQFFAYIYEYYQQRGLTCIALRSLFSLLRFAFVVLFSTFLVNCVDYDVLFYNRNTTLDGRPLPAKRAIHNAFIPRCYARINPLMSLALFLAALFWLAHLFRIFCRLVQFSEIRRFFISQLEIADSEMQNLSWAQVVERLCGVQKRLHLIVNREAITPLDVCQRILRHKNYFVALVYYNILPPKIRLPFLGHVHYLSNGLRFNLEWLLFWGPWSPWKGPYALKDEFKDPAKLPMIVRQLQRTLTIMAIANLIFFPFVFVYQLLFSFFSYSEHYQRDPNVFGMRKYSNYGREKLRHFNEMDHELDARLNKSYEFAARYTDQFISPLTQIIARNIAFVAASFFVVLCALTAIDEDTLKIEHVTTILSITGGAVLISRIFIPKENMVFCQHLLMQQIVANIHYAPRSWLANAHSTEIHKEFVQIFRMKTELLIEELLSPFLSPFILYFCVWKRVPEIVVFLHENTVTLEGLGDVCSLAQMNISRDGDTRLVSLNQSVCVDDNENNKNKVSTRRRRTPCGKVELSLLNFATQNPDWVPTGPEAEFIANVKDLVSTEVFGILENMENQRLLYQRSNNKSVVLPTNAEKNYPLTMQKSSEENVTPTTSQQSGPVLAEQKEEETFTGVGGLPSASQIERQRQLQEQSLANILSNSSSLRGMLTTSIHSQLNLQQQHQMLLASSFIAPASLSATVQPRTEQENKATEMSLNALAINHILAINTNPNELIQQQQNVRSRYNKNNRGYGSIRNKGGIITETQPILDSMAESNIWGVPDLTATSRLNNLFTSSINSSSMLLGGGREGGERGGNFKGRNEKEEEEMKQINKTVKEQPSTTTSLSITAPPPPPLQPFYVDDKKVLKK
uniref:Autophagy-related protein 9 n=1 Tax=Meloidogyne incognita TaxID=6306 RepID=A0A914LZT9_MELIC